MSDAGPFKSFARWEIGPDEVEVVAATLARFAVLVDPELDEWESFDIIKEFLDETDINIVNIVDLVAMIKCTKFNPKLDTVH